MTKLISLLSIVLLILLVKNGVLTFDQILDTMKYAVTGVVTLISKV